MKSLRCEHCGALLKKKKPKYGRATNADLSICTEIVNRMLTKVMWVYDYNPQNGKARLIKVTRKSRKAPGRAIEFDYNVLVFGDGYALSFRKLHDVVDAFERYRKEHPGDTLVREVNKRTKDKEQRRN